jgi:hypothetical protein
VLYSLKIAPRCFENWIVVERGRKKQPLALRRDHAPESAFRPKNSTG